MLTSESTHAVYVKRLYGGSVQTLGGCGCNSKESNNYFVLLGKVKEQTSGNIFSVPNATPGYGIRVGGSTIRPMIGHGTQEIWQLRPSTLLVSDYGIESAESHTPLGLTPATSVSSIGYQGLQDDAAVASPNAINEVLSQLTRMHLLN